MAAVCGWRESSVMVDSEHEGGSSSPYSGAHTGPNEPCTPPPRHEINQTKGNRPTPVKAFTHQPMPPPMCDYSMCVYIYRIYL